MKSLQSTILSPLIIFTATTNVFGQTLPCDNMPYWSLGNSNIGIHTGSVGPLKPLHIHGYASPLFCNEVTQKFSYGENVASPDYSSFISLTIPTSLNWYTTVPSHGLGDFVLSSAKDRTGGNIILTTKDPLKSIIFTTTLTRTPEPPNPPYDEENERQKIYGNGRIDFNVGAWNKGLPKIMMYERLANLSVRLYRSTGNAIEPEESYPWWIENTYDTLPNMPGTLLFRSNHEYPWYDVIGQETPVTRVAIRQNGNVGINNEEPMAKLQVTEGNVVFDGSRAGEEEEIPEGAGTRFMWIPAKGALRAGRVDGIYPPKNGSDFWNLSNLGYYSYAFGRNNKSYGDYSFSVGEYNFSLGNHSISIGSENYSSANVSVAMGFLDSATQNYSTAIGYQNRAFGHSSIALGTNTHSTNNWSSALGDQVYSEGEHSQAFGFNTRAKGFCSTTMGTAVKVESSHGGTFMIGDDNWKLEPDEDPPRTISDNGDEIVLRFTGPDSSENNNNFSFKLITGYDDINDDEIGICAYHKGYGWHIVSDSTLKRNIQNVDEYDMLNRLRNIPIKTWMWKDYWTYKDSTLVYDISHNIWMGPMAQDFYGEFPYGVNDNTKLSTGIMDAVMFASIQSLANITDTIKFDIEQLQGKSDKYNNKLDSFLTKTEYYLFKDSIYCYYDACERIDSLEKKTEKMLLQSEFSSFKDSIKCYKDVCNRIIYLEEIIDKMKEQIDSLESKLGSISGENIKDNEQIQNYESTTNNKYEDIILEQNNPNPFSETTDINYYIPINYKSGLRLIVSDELGAQRYLEIIACVGKPCQIKFSAKELKTGVYIYALLSGNQIVKSKKMMIIK